MLQTRAPARVTPEIAAEAAVWVTRLHGPQRCRQMEEECLAWQQRSPAHQEAFERCTDTWEGVPRVTVASAFAASTVTGRRKGAGSRPSTTTRWGVAGVLAAVLMVGAVGYQQWRDLGVYATGIGEQQLVVLDDGTRMTLNTATEVRVEHEASRRTVSIRRGEALFEVARDPSRPFVVRAGGSEVVAIGTVFSVRFTSLEQGRRDALAVTLLEGQVALQPASGEQGLAPQQTVRMVAGERVRLSGDGPGSQHAARTEVDRPNVAQLVAWKRSEAVFEGASLLEAVSEMNRYSRTPIVLRDPSGLAKLQVSGIYRTGDATGFANAVAALHGLDVREQAGRLELSKPQ